MGPCNYVAHLSTPAWHDKQATPGSPMPCELSTLATAEKIASGGDWLQGAWENSQQKDECSVRMHDLEWDYWMGTEVGQLGGYGFQRAIFGVDGSFKDGTMGSGCCKFQGERQTNVHEPAEKRKAQVRTGGRWGEL